MKSSFETTALEIFQYANGDWYVKLADWISICVGAEAPDIKKGDKVKVSLEKVDD